MHKIMIAILFLAGQSASAAVLSCQVARTPDLTPVPVSFPISNTAGATARYELADFNGTKVEVDVLTYGDGTDFPPLKADVNVSALVNGIRIYGSHSLLLSTVDKKTVLHVRCEVTEKAEN